MVASKAVRWAGLCLAGMMVVGAAVPAAAAGLKPGEYACAGSGGILIGLGFRLKEDDTYTDLDRTTSGRVVYSGTTVSFIGGHLAGQTGRNVRNGTNFEINAISCSHV